MARVKAPATIAARVKADRQKKIAANQKKTKYKTVYEEVEEEKKQLKQYVVLDNEFWPRNYSFVLSGSPLLTAQCKEVSRRRGLDVLETKHRGQNGYLFANSVITEAKNYLDFQPLKPKPRRRSPDTAQRVSNVSQDRLDAEAYEKIRELYPRMPQEEIRGVIGRAFDLTKDTVGTDLNQPMHKRVQLAVIAHIRHQHTAYDQILRQTSSGDRRIAARQKIEEEIMRQIVDWQAPETGINSQTEAVLREYIVIDDDENVDDEDEMQSDDDSAANAPSQARAATNSSAKRKANRRKKKKSAKLKAALARGSAGQTSGLELEAPVRSPVSSHTRSFERPNSPMLDQKSLPAVKTECAKDLLQSLILTPKFSVSAVTSPVSPEHQQRPHFPPNGALDSSLIQQPHQRLHPSGSQNSTLEAIPGPIPSFVGHLGPNPNLQSSMPAYPPHSEFLPSAQLGYPNSPTRFPTGQYPGENSMGSRLEYAFPNNAFQHHRQTRQTTQSQRSFDYRQPPGPNRTN